ncbi:TonB-dependent receptor plug domain-containing protein [Marinobacterium ramblicola]|uniref:TonB-dependent receptor plug domain-containing protein n=1 Tax=Marinobacterium ramblicola TaxID=2849041 RepID=UPI001C2CE546|nr:TonB-dependent receptor [Marinobacterium ramblicola]
MLLLAALLLASPVQYVFATSTTELADLSLEELSKIQVTSVSRKQEKLSAAAASIFVISAEDIRRSGARSLPELLRLAPNLQVARVDAQTYAISARGFNSTIANKLQVLIDGRIVYTPLFSGVFWDEQAIMLENIERIEVISGPASASWGSNAVNGVINIITRRAEDTQGGLVALQGGNSAQDAAYRHGGALESGRHYRVYARTSHDNESNTEMGEDANDSWSSQQVGFRLDGDADEGLSLQGDAYSGRLDNGNAGDARISGVNLMTRWEQPFEDDERLTLSAYFDHRERDFPGTYNETLDILNLELQHTLQPTARQQVIWGIGYRTAWDKLENTPDLAFLPADKRLTWSSLFVQDKIELSDAVLLTLAGRLEDNSYTGVELMPSARLAWHISDDRLLWAAVSRAVRTPSRLDREFYVPADGSMLAGGPGFRSETLNAVEVGYRAQQGKRLNYNLTLFYHDYDDIRSLDPSSGGAFIIGNNMEARVHGLEAWGVAQITESWRLNAGFTLMDRDLEFKTADAGDGGSGEDPDYQWRIGSRFDIGSKTELDLTLRRVGDMSNGGAPAYTAFDMRLGWRLSEGTELSLSGYNLLDPRHPEFGSTASRREVDRSLLLKLVHRY